MEELSDVYNIQDSLGIEKDDLNIRINPYKNVWIILSFISWVLLITVQINTIQYQIPFSMIDSIYYTGKLLEYDYIYIIFDSFPQYIFLIINLSAFVIYLIFTIYQKDENILTGLFKKTAKLHFLPLFCVSSLYIMSESYPYFKFKDEELLDRHLALFISNSALTLVGSILLIIVYAKTKLNCQWYVIFFIKKGAYSSLIMLLWENILCNIFYLAYDTKIYTCILFPIIRGLGAIIFSLIFNDIMVLFISLLYNIKTLEMHYLYYYYLSPEKTWIEVQIGYISLTMFLITLILMIVLIAQFRHKLYIS